MLAEVCLFLAASSHITQRMQGKKIFILLRASMSFHGSTHENEDIPSTVSLLLISSMQHPILDSTTFAPHKRPNGSQRMCRKAYGCVDTFSEVEVQALAFSAAY